MKIALLPSIPDLERFQDESSIHLLLAHLFHEGRYTDHYRKRRQRGDYLIVDNGACENDRPVSMGWLLSCARQVQAQEVVIPDVQFEAGSTLAELRKAIRYIQSPTGDEDFRWAGGPRLMFVPQGQSQMEWSICLEEGLNELKKAKISPVVAVAKQYEPMHPDGRLGFVRFLREAGCLEVHLLGWSPPWESLERCAAGAPWIRSVDSAKPLTYAMRGERLELEVHIERTPRPDDYFDRSIPPEHEFIARANINTFRQAAGARARLGV